MPEQYPALHAYTHLPGGSDPLPGGSSYGVYAGTLSAAPAAISDFSWTGAFLAGTDLFNYGGGGFTFKPLASGLYALTVAATDDTQVLASGEFGTLGLGNFPSPSFNFANMMIGGVFADGDELNDGPCCSVCAVAPLVAGSEYAITFAHTSASTIPIETNIVAVLLG